VSHERVLVVDDEKLIRFTLRESLAEEGYVVHEAAGVDEAKKVFARHRIDCVILDHKLPDGDGFQLLETLKEEAPDVPVIGIGGRTQTNSMRCESGRSTLRPRVRFKLMGSSGMR
jgi:DNA-binding response OmpR family regulator